MDGRSAKQSLVVACAVVASVALAHRAILLLVHRADVAALVATNPTWYTFQQLPVEMLRDHLALSLVYLQQTPPLPNLVVGLVGKVVDFPLGLAYALIALNSLVSILAGLVLVHLLSLLYPRRVLLWIVVSLCFVINADLVVLEYNSHGQTIYGVLTMLLVLSVVDLLVVFRRSPRSRYAAGAGMATALLALTRATWSLFVLPGAMLVILLAGPSRRARCAVAFALPVVLLQGGWIVKNWLVYGVLSPATSTMGGIHLLAGLNSAGFGNELQKFRFDRVTIENGYLDWQVAFVRNEPGALEHALHIGDGDPREHEIEEVFGMPNPQFNTATTRMLAQFHQRVVLDFAVRHPLIMLTKWARAYAIFWQPIASYGRMYVALFAGGGHDVTGLDPVGIARELAARTLPGRHELQSGSCGAMPRAVPCRYTPTSMLTLRWLEPVLLVVTSLGVHVLLPLVGVCWLLRGMGRHGRSEPPRSALRLAALGIAATTYWYLAGIANFVETSENMRYRLEVEPLVWLITLVSATELMRLARPAPRDPRPATVAARPTR